MAPRPRLDVVPMRRRTPPAGAGPELSGGEEAGAQLRREVLSRTRSRVLLATLAAVGTALVVAIGHTWIQGDLPTIWVVTALAVAIWWGLAGHARRAAATDLTGVAHPRSATVVRAPHRLAVEVRDSTGAAWRWRRRATARPLAAGERCWIFGEGPLQEAPHLVMARPVGPGRYVVWASADRTISRLPDPVLDQDTDAQPTVVDDEPYS